MESLMASMVILAFLFLALRFLPFGIGRYFSGLFKKALLSALRRLFQKPQRSGGGRIARPGVRYRR